MELPRPGRSFVWRFFAHLLVRLLVLTPLPPQFQAVAVLFPVSVTRRASKRILDRGIRMDDIHSALETPTLVEDYPDGAPSGPVGPGMGERPAVARRACGPDRGGGTIIVTLYEPDLERFEPGFTRRKPKP